MCSSELDLKRAQHNDLKMGEMEPTESFNLILRGYQKQALLFVPFGLDFYC